MLLQPREDCHGDAGMARDAGGDVPAIDRGKVADVRRDGCCAGGCRSSPQEAGRQAESAESGDAVADDVGILARIPYVSAHRSQLRRE